MSNKVLKQTETTWSDGSGLRLESVDGSCYKLIGWDSDGVTWEEDLCEHPTQGDRESYNVSRITIEFDFTTSYGVVDVVWKTVPIE